jgi:hypothetical protein
MQSATAVYNLSSKRDGAPISCRAQPQSLMSEARTGSVKRGNKMKHSLRVLFGVMVATAGLALMLPARAHAACPGTNTGQLTGTGHGEAVTGTINGVPNHRAGFAGVIFAKIGSQTNVPSFCINLLNTISVGDCFNAGGPTTAQITWLLNHGFGPDNNLSNSENASRQAAVWYFSDSFVTTDSHASRVQAIINSVPANPDPQADVPQMTLDPPSAVNVLPGNSVHTLTISVMNGGDPVANQTVSLSTGFGQLSADTAVTDASGSASFTVTNTAGTAGTANITATFTAPLPAGTVFDPVVSGKQKLVLATPTTATVVANATKQWVVGGTILAHKFLDANADTVQGPDEPNLSNWTMNLSLCSANCDSPCIFVTSATTNSNGDASFGSRAAGCYRVDEVFPAPVAGHQNWHNTTEASQWFVLAANGAQQAVFGNIIYSVIVVQKFDDANGDSVQEGSEAFLDGWRITLQRFVNSNWIPLNEGLTSGGQVVFSDLPPGHYRVQEDLQTGWRTTIPTNPYDFDLGSDSIATVKFGNTCDAGFFGAGCAQQCPGGASNPCNGQGACSDGEGGTGACACVPGFSGAGCDINIDDCSPNPCQNAGSCTDGVNSYTCTCSTGFTGANCQTNVDDCSPNPCQNGGSCVDGVSSHTCQCPAGFAGANCEIDINDCSPNPCLNGGQCADQINGYACTCAVGYTGTNCQTNVDDCAPSPCQNGGACVDGVNSYTCQCPAGFTGLNCETNINDCSPNPCLNGGQCTDQVNGYACTCAAGFTGSNCQTNVDDCAPNPCQNGGACVDGVNSHSCQCPAGFTGANCETNINDCSPNPCLNGGTCVDGVNSYTCQCPAGITGQNCQSNIDDCDPNPCLNSGQCTDQVNGYTCTCAAGYAGTNCQTNVDDCAPNPCQNGGACVDGVNSHSCQCPAGFTGANCETNINECSSSPCLNGGVCSDGVNAYTCTCAAGFTGTNCQTNVNDCAPNPCQNGAVCIDGVNSYTCQCPAGFIGANCQTNINECSPNPCLNGGVCTDGINSYTCTCATGFSGSNCQTNIDDCSPNPCQNGGTCVDGLNSHTCICAGGLVGPSCDQCAPGRFGSSCVPCPGGAATPCNGHGVCSDGLAGTGGCTCTAGFIGASCDQPAPTATVVTVTPTVTPTITSTRTPTPTRTRTRKPTRTPRVEVQDFCAVSPLSGCRSVVERGRSMLQLLDRANNRNDMVIWRWFRGAATTTEEFGNPVESTIYNLCVYDSIADTPSLVLGSNIPSAGDCNMGRPCWRANRNGYLYHDRNGVNSGTRLVLLTKGEATKSRLLYIARGINVFIPELPLDQDHQVIVQFKNSNGMCWEGRYSRKALVNRRTLFIDRSD